jgi:hypothetical protein
MTLPSRSLAVAVSLLLVAAAAAEVPKPPVPGGNKQAVFQMRSGNVRVKDDPKNREVIKVVAEWLAYSLCQPPFNGEQPPPSVKLPVGQDNMTYLMDEAKYLCDIRSGTTAKPGQEQLEFADEFGKAIAAATGVVLKESAKPIERINAVRLMSVAARVPAPSLADSLVAVVNNPKGSDAEKLYAFQGLRNLLDQEDVNDPSRHIFGASAGNPKLGEIATALTNYVMQKRTPRDDKEGAVIEFVRRDAVAALAKFRDPSIRKANRELIARPAWALARVIAQDPAVYPPFTIQEQMEAATGFAQMKVDPDMSLDLSAYIMAGLLVNAARAANLDNERAVGTNTLPVIQWKLTAARWSYALSVWRKNVESVPAGRNPGAVREVAGIGIAMLTEIEKTGAAAQTAGGVQQLITWGTNNPPKAWAEMKPATLFTDDPQTVLPFPAAPAPTADPKLKSGDPKAAPVPKKGPEPKKGATPPKKGG